MRNAQPEDVHPIQIATHGIDVDDPSFRRALEPAFKFLWSVTAGALVSYGGGSGQLRRGLDCLSSITASGQADIVM